MMARFIIALLISLPALSAWCQTNFYVRGIVRDAATKAPVPFVSVAINGTTRGTAADEDGKFLLLIRNEDRDRKLKFSCIGYVTKQYSVNELSEDTALIDLESDVKLLSEITISENSINPRELIKSALDSIPVNYMLEPFNLEYYGVLMAKNFLTSQEMKLETLAFGYCEGYAVNSRKIFNIERMRLSGRNPFQPDFAFWPTLEIHRGDQIAHPVKNGVLNLDMADKFDYKYEGVLLYEMDTVYKITYHAPKPTKKLTGYGIVPKVYKGTIYITTATHAIVRHDIETDNFDSSIIYKKIGEHYFPYLIKGERRIESAFADIQNSMILTDVNFENVKMFSNATNEFSEGLPYPEDNEFWQVNFPQH